MHEMTSDQIAHLSRLARIQLTSEEEARFAGQLSSVVEYIEKLSEVDTSSVKVLIGVTGMSNVFAEDVARTENDPRTVDHETLLKGAPAREGDFIEVRAVMGEEVVSA